MMMIAALTLIVALQPTPQPPPSVPPAMQALAEANALFEKRDNAQALAAYDRAIALDPANADAHIGRARTLQRLRKFDEAIAACTEAIRLRPDHAMGYRYRGHFSINVRKLDAAVADLTKAEALKKDDYNIYYHLGLAHYLGGAFDKAAQGFEGCLRSAKSDDEIVACSTWLYPSLKRAGKDAEAARVLDRIAPTMAIKENAAYLDRLLLFKGVKTEDQVAKTLEASDGKTEDDRQLAVSTVGYGLGLWHLLNSRTDRAREYFQKATGTTYWPAFGYIASEIELKRLKTVAGGYSPSW